jgi:DNA polymerase-3 subunit epsilon
VLEFDFEPDLPEWSKTLVGFDLETTGLDLATSRIVTASIVRIDASGDTVESKDWLINPGIEIPPEAAAVHGVTTEMARQEGMDPKLALAEVAETLRSYFNALVPVVAFNAPYDFTILRNELVRNKLASVEAKPVVDPLVLDKKFVKFRKGKRTLGILCGHYSIELLNAHQSSADALAAVRLAQQQARIFSKDIDRDVTALHENQIAWSKEQDEDFAKFMADKNPNFKLVPGWPEKN